MTPQPRRHRLARALAIAGAIVAAGAFTGTTLAWRSGPPPDRVGACGFGPTCRDAAAGCHSLVGSGTLAWDVTTTAPAPGPLPPAYVPGRTYHLRLDVQDTEPGAAVWGFQLAAIDCNTWPGGMLAVIDPQRTRLEISGGIGYLSHRCTCPTDEAWCCGYVPEVAPDRNGWPLDWTAPPAGTGDVELAVAFNAANWDGTPAFDRITVDSLVLPEEPCPPPVADLRVRLAECDPAFPGQRRVELSWTPAGSGPQFVRRADPATVELPEVEWPEMATACDALDPRPLVFYSVAGTCSLGSESPH